MMANAPIANEAILEKYHIFGQHYSIP